MNTLYLKRHISRLHINFLGKNIKDKIIVIESDDWGSIRTPSKAIRDNLDKLGIPLSEYPYTRYDGLETNEDIDELANLLANHIDERGQPVCLTMNYVLQNPNFNEIAKDNYSKYSGESIMDTYRYYLDSDQVLEKVKKASHSGLFLPQFHGREHVNVPIWLEVLQNNHQGFKIAFENRMFGLGLNSVSSISNNIQATYDTQDNEYALESLRSGLSLFQEVFGFHSKSFIANNFIWSDKWNGELKDLGISHFQGMKYQLLPKAKNISKRSRILHYGGEINEFNQLYTVRNCEFEPSITGLGHRKTLEEVKLAFAVRQPAVISSHRVNFTSRIDEKQRDQNLLELDILLKKVKSKWPDVLFMSSNELENYYRNLLIT